MFTKFDIPEINIVIDGSISPINVITIPVRDKIQPIRTDKLESQS